MPVLEGMSVAMSTVAWAECPLWQLVADADAGWLSAPVSGDVLARIRHNRLEEVAS